MGERFSTLEDRTYCKLSAKQCAHVKRKNAVATVSHQITTEGQFEENIQNMKVCLQQAYEHMGRFGRRVW